MKCRGWADAEQALSRLDEEKNGLLALRTREAEEQETADIEVKEITNEVAALDAEVTRLMEDVASVDAERAAALRAMAEGETRCDRLRQRATEIAGILSRAEAELIDPAELTSAEMELEEALEYLETSRDQADDAERCRNEAQAARDNARDAWQSQAALRAKLQAEADGLQAALAQSTTGTRQSVLDDVCPWEGFETALGAVLGEDLSAPVEESSFDDPIVWHLLPPLSDSPALPDGTESLAHYVTRATGIGSPAGTDRCCV